MTTDSIVTVLDTSVMYVAGETGKPIAGQAPKAFKELEAKLSSLKGRKFYGVVLGDEYRACVACLYPGPDAFGSDSTRHGPHRSGYSRCRIPSWASR